MAASNPAPGLAAKARYNEILGKFKDQPEERVWPESLGDEAYIGLAGDVVRAIEPHTEEIRSRCSSNSWLHSDRSSVAVRTI